MFAWRKCDVGVCEQKSERTVRTVIIERNSRNCVIKILILYIIIIIYNIKYKDANFCQFGLSKLFELFVRSFDNGGELVLSK